MMSLFWTTVQLRKARTQKEIKQKTPNQKGIQSINPFHKLLKQAMHITSLTVMASPTEWFKSSS